MKHRRTRKVKDAGFTLIELSLFIILIGFVLATMMPSFLTSVLNSEKPDIVASAVFLGTERMEQLQSLPYSSIVNEASTPLTGNFSAFSRQVSVTLVDANLAVSASDVGYKSVVVTVYHNQLPAGGLSITSLFTDFTG